MTRYRSLVCQDPARRALLQEVHHQGQRINGIDFIEVSLDQRALTIAFVNPLPADAYDLPAHPQRICIEGGVRIRDIQVLSVQRAGDHELTVAVDRVGDYSIYRLSIESDLLDPLYAQGDFSFKVNCPSDFDCQNKVIRPPQTSLTPNIDYLAKDYASFRQALIDLIPSLAPQWQERHEADLGMALLELLAYAGDQLSYYQDAVATEAYLETARQRISVRRHARLLDYQMHDGVSARTFVHFQGQSPGRVAAGTPVLSRITASLADGMTPGQAIIPPELAQQALNSTDIVFETIAPVDVHPNLNEISIHDWGNFDCCLPAGTTTLDLVGDLAYDPAQDGPDGARHETWRLKPGDYLLLEEMLGPETGLAADADVTHRQVVRLSTVASIQNPLRGLTLTRVRWQSADALTFPLCLSATLPDGRVLTSVSVGRANLALADHGRTLAAEPHHGPAATPRGLRRLPYRLALKQAPLSFRATFSDGNGMSPASALYEMDPHRAQPQVKLTTQRTGSSLVTHWQPVTPDLLRSRAYDAHFVAETDNHDRAILRFGDNAFGMAPPEDATFSVTYRVGVGRAGNIGADSLVHTLADSSLPLITAIRNPLPAWGGMDPEPIEQVKELAPIAFQAEQFRAVTEADYAYAAEKHPQVSKAQAMFRWTGSWMTVFITVDPVGRTDLPPTLQDHIKRWVQRYTLAGYDLEIDPPIYVPLEIDIHICVKKDYFRAHVKKALFKVLSNHAWPDGVRGFFHPGNFTFGQPLYFSQLYAAIEAAPGVDSVTISKCQRFGKLPNNELAQGYVPAERLEVLRLDNDPSLPENGVLRLYLEGGQ